MAFVCAMWHVRLNDFGAVGGVTGRGLRWRDSPFDMVMHHRYPLQRLKRIDYEHF